MIRPLQLVLVRNLGRGALGAVLTGFAALMHRVWSHSRPTTTITGRESQMIEKHQEGHDIVAASRFMAGGQMEGCPWLKAVLVRTAAFFMYHIARVPTRDASNGLRLFSRRVLDEIPIESEVGFAYSIELLVKAHRLGWPIAETPFLWRERKAGQSRFRTIRWLPQYLRWLVYALGTTYVRLGPRTVRLRPRSS